jgi:hypothetical protein
MLILGEIDKFMAHFSVLNACFFSYKQPSKNLSNWGIWAERRDLILLTPPFLERHFWGQKGGSKQDHLLRK